MHRHADRLYELLPAIYRQRDAEQGYSLRALLRVIAEQVDSVEEDIGQLYENWFIETCQSWVVPYLGELIGYRPMHGVANGKARSDAEDGQREAILLPRRELANTIRYRRRKGALALLELLADDVAGWPARAVELYRLLAWTQNVNHTQLQRGRVADLREVAALEDLDSPFDRLAHRVDVRRLSSHRTPGRCGIPHVGLFVWRLKSCSVTRTPAYCLDEVGRPNSYSFSVLGNDTPLHTRPRPETDPTQIAVELNLPTPVRRRDLEHDDRVRGRVVTRKASTAYYGEDKSLVIWAPDWPKKSARQPLPSELIVPANLKGWRYDVPRDRVAVDPELGLIAFNHEHLPKHGVFVSYHYAFGADLGGGEYDREIPQPPAISKPAVAEEAPARNGSDAVGEAEPSAVYRVGHGEPFARINDALARWQNDQPRYAVIEIGDSGVYVEQLNIELGAGQTLQMQAANRTRPVIRLLDWHTEKVDSLRVSGQTRSRFILDGLMVTGRGLQFVGPDNGDARNAEAGDLCEIKIRHCTLVPGWNLHPDCNPKRADQPSLELVNSHARLRIERSIVGSIQINSDARHAEPVVVDIRDSIVDATDLGSEALSGSECRIAPARLSIVRSTVLGRVCTHAIELAENTIFAGQVNVARRQIGCMRFCYVAPGSRTPRRFECQPDLAEERGVNQLRAEREKQGSVPTRDEIEARREAERERVQPRFDAVRYGNPTYCQLADACADEIRRGAEDESEMGVFHDQYRPQRAANLRTRLAEHVPAGVEAAVIFAS